MTTIDIHALQANPLLFLARVEAGETLRISRDQRVVAELKPIVQATSARNLPTHESRLAEMNRPRTAEELNGPPRPFGLCKGEIEISDDFNDPLPEEILREFEGT
jgi:antitoxin (DNA-binding transcriptional repressor) of toxin-antitoxin stability system